MEVPPLLEALPHQHLLRAADPVDLEGAERAVELGADRLLHQHLLLAADLEEDLEADLEADLDLEGVRAVLTGSGRRRDSL